MVVCVCVCECGERERRLEGDRSSRHCGALLFLLLHDSLVGGFYRNGQTKLGGILYLLSALLTGLLLFFRILSFWGMTYLLVVDLA